MVKSLITGITGFVGSHLAEYLLSKGEEVYGIKRWRSPLDNIQHILDKITLYDCDLREPKAVYSIINNINYDFIYHLAAQSYVPYSFQHPIDTMETNLIGTMNLYEAVILSGYKPVIHFCSSSEVYGQVKQDCVPIKESQPFNPMSPYGASKAAADIMSSVYYQVYGLQIIRSRAFTHTGPRRGKDFVVSAFAKQIAEIEAGIKKPIIYVGNLDSIRTFLDVRDIVKAYWLLVRKCEHGKSYNIGGIYTMTINELLNRLLDMSDIRNKVEICISKDLLRPKDVTLQIPDCTKFVKITEWQPEIELQKTLFDVLEYWREKVINENMEK